MSSAAWKTASMSAHVVFWGEALIPKRIHRTVLRRTQAVDFDIADYKERTARLEWDDLPLAQAFADQPLSPDVLRCIRYMHDVEFHTVCYLRDLLLTPAHADPTVTAFLSFWVFEEFWHGEALAAVLRAHGEPAGDERVAGVRSGLGRADKVRPLLMTLASAVAGPDFTAVHMTWGAVNEWTTQAGYAALSRRADHPVLTELLRRIMKQEGRHIDFYASQAEARLARSGKARRMVRFALRKLWRPVGSGVMPAAETRFLIDTLFGDEAGRTAVARIDRRIDRLPGLAGLDLVAHAA
jgi:hypothetical protein